MPGRPLLGDKFFKAVRRSGVPLGLRRYLKQVSEEGRLIHIKDQVSPRLESSGILKALEPSPVHFERITGKDFPVVGNLFCSKKALAAYFGIPAGQLLPLLLRAVETREPPPLIENPPCQQVVEEEVDLNRLPILLHCEGDGGNYITSAVVVTRDPDYGQNMDFHRAMQIGKDKMSTRVVEGRHFHRFLEKNGELEVAYCIGNPPNILLAAATSVDLGVDELQIAHALENLPVTRAKTVDLQIPAECEFVLEGRVYLNERCVEGPFVDLTGTYDIPRREPVFQVKKITRREDAIWQALLPGGLEHRVLMGTPREPIIYDQVKKRGVRCLDVNLSHGGCSWLHAIVKIDKQREEDGGKAIEAAFQGHGSCKHVFIVDKDIDIYDPVQVEWAMATRFQGDRNLLRRGREPGSSLDPSADPETNLTTKMGFDLTIPLDSKKNFLKAAYPRVDPSKYARRGKP